MFNFNCLVCNRKWSWSEKKGCYLVDGKRIGAFQSFTGEPAFEKDCYPGILLWICLCGRINAATLITWDNVDEYGHFVCDYIWDKLGEKNG